MKVAHRDDYDTHAVIGGKGIQEFGISTSAEFFSILSDQIYTNKPLAVIREVLCNAWDAHIVAGKTDVPVIIKIDEDKLSIRDFGLGIPHDLIHPIYCVYGNSTKENDGNQTGGFGLGSKAPFSYSDHFTVNNQHDGLKVVHAISRGSAQTQGKPDRRVMVSVPTTETGVEVVVPVKSKHDMHLFIEIAQEIAAFGEMNVEINGKRVETVPISKAENNMFLTTRRPRGSDAKLNIRYGNVVYPVRPDAEYIGVYEKISKLLKAVPSEHGEHYENDFVMILQAPANTISVTPSRESLQTTETTVKTIRSLFSALIDHMEMGTAVFEERLLTEQAKAIDHMWANGYEDRIMFSKNLLTDEKGPKSVTMLSGVKQISNMTELADYYLRNKTKISDQLKFKLEMQRVQLQIKKGFRQKHFLKRYLNIMRKTKNFGLAGDMFAKSILFPLVRHVAKHPILNTKHLQIAQPAHREKRYAWAPLIKYTPDNREFLVLVQGVVIVTHNKMAYEEDWNYRVSEKLKVPNDMERIVYVAPRTKGHKEAAVELFTKLGYYVIDFATILDEYRASIAPEPVYKGIITPMVAPAKPKKTGLVLLSTNVDKKGNFLLTNHLKEGQERSEDFDYVLKPYMLAPKHGYGKKFFSWGDSHAEDIVSLFGSKIGICVNEPQYESQIKKGKKSALHWIAETIAQKVLTSTSIRRYVENEKGVLRTTNEFDCLLEMTKYSAVLAKLFDIPEAVSEDDLVYYQIFQDIISDFRYGHKVRPNDGDWKQFIWDANEEVKLWTKAKAFADMEEVIKNSKGLDLLDLYQMKNTLRDMNKSNPDYQKKVFIESSIVNALKF